MATPGTMPQAKTMPICVTRCGATTAATRPSRIITMTLAIRMTIADMRTRLPCVCAWRENIMVVAVYDARPPKMPSTAAPCRVPMMRRAM